MALTPAQKMKEYRQRLKEKGGKPIMLTLSPENLRTIEIFSKYNCPDSDHGETIRLMIACSLKRVQNELKEMIKLKDDLGASDETIKGYIDFLRWEFEGGLVITAEKYLELSSETERLSDEYLAEQMPSNK